MILENNISLLVHDVDFDVVTDGKWLEFIVNQIISNSIKYMDVTGKTERSIEIWAEKGRKQDYVTHKKTTELGYRRPIFQECVTNPLPGKMEESMQSRQEWGCLL